MCPRTELNHLENFLESYLCRQEYLQWVIPGLYSIGYLNTCETHVTTYKSTNNNVVFFLVPDLKTGTINP